jgi:uncharacterized membrane protein
VPFDNVRKLIALRLAHAPPLPGTYAADFFEHWLAHGTGGTCWSSSNALQMLLVALGFTTRRIAGSMRDLGIITHGSTQLMVLSMLLFGGATLHYFALALTIGILFGIYSSVFVAAAIAMWLGIKREDLIKVVKKDGPDEDPNDPNAGAMV